MMVRWVTSFTILVSCVCTGCTGPLPRYEWVNSVDAMATMTERAGRIESVSASGRLSLSRADGTQTQLDFAMVYSRPDQFRFRAWKFSQAVMDFTMNADGVWIVAPDRGDEGESGLPDSLSVDQMAKSWSLIVSEFSLNNWVPCALQSPTLPNTLVLCGKNGTESDGIVCEIDRDTLTTQSCYAHNDEGDELFHLTLQRYRRFDEVVFPTRIHGIAGGNEITWMLDEVELNEPPAPRAFVPPRRAVKQP